MIYTKANVDVFVSDKTNKSVQLIRNNKLLGLSADQFGMVYKDVLTKRGTDDTALHAKTIATAKFTPENFAAAMQWLEEEES